MRWPREAEWSSNSYSKNPKEHWGLRAIQVVLVNDLNMADWVLHSLEYDQQALS